MKRAFDGTLAERLPGVLGRLNAIPIDDRIRDLIGSIAWFSGCVTDIVPKRIVDAVTNIFKGKEGAEMTETIQRGVFQKDRLEGELMAKVSAISKLLQTRFKQIPDTVVDELNGRTDLIALESLFEIAAQCDSIEEFVDALK